MILCAQKENEYVSSQPIFFLLNTQAKKKMR